MLSARVVTVTNPNHAAASVVEVDLSNQFCSHQSSRYLWCKDFYTFNASAFMDFLKSAVASAISKGPPFPYNFGDRVDLDTGIWTLFNGTKREDGSKCSIFSFDINSNKYLLSLARNAVKKLRTLRHPKIVKVLDTVESDSYIYIATERVVPLSWHMKRKSLSIEIIIWGLYSVAQTIKFINDDAASIHGSIRLRSIFTSESGEWKLGGFEFVSCIKDDNAIIYSHGNFLTDADRHTPPEISKSGWEVIKKNPLTAVDAYDFGILISEVFGDHNTGDIQALPGTNIPKNIQASYRRLINSNPKARVSVGDFLDQGTRRGGFFTTPLIAMTGVLEHFGMKNEQEQKEFLDELDRLSDDIPVDYIKMKVLPELINCIEFSGGGPRTLSIVINLSKKLSEDEFDQKIIPAIVKFFGRPDRAMRVCLLDSLPILIDRLPQKIVNDKIFPQMITGFTDAAPVVREQSIKAVLTIIDKLSDKSINGELLKYLAKTSNDEQSGIRTNTTICLGKIYKNLSVRTRAKVLIAAFTRSLRDPFIHARNAALMALAVTSDAFSEDDSANRILPALCPCLIDKEKIVRDQANKTMDIYLKKLQKFASSMPDSILPPSTAESSSVVPQLGTPQSSEAATWTGWAISSFTNKMSEVAGEIIASTASSGTNAQLISTHSNENQNSLVSNTVQSNSTAGGRLHTHSELEPVRSNLITDTFHRNAESLYESDYNGENDETFFDFTPGNTELDEDQSSKFDRNDEEPDFAGWLVAQAGKKLNARPLPKGLASSISAPKVVSNNNKSNNYTSNSTTRFIANKPASRVIAAKKINTTPNENEDDNWGDGW